MGFSRKEYWSGLPCPFPGDLPDPGIKPSSLMSPALAGEFFITSATWETQRFPHAAAKIQDPTYCNYDTVQPNKEFFKYIKCYFKKKTPRGELYLSFWDEGRFQNEPVEPPKGPHQRGFKKASPPHQQLDPPPPPSWPGGTERSTRGWGQDRESHLASGWPLRGTPL